MTRKANSRDLHRAERIVLDDAIRRRLNRAYRRLDRAFLELTDIHILSRACDRSHVVFAHMDTLHDVLFTWIDSGIGGDDTEIKKVVSKVLDKVLQDLKIDAAERTSTDAPTQ
jgi:hypothetical protein